MVFIEWANLSAINYVQVQK